MQVTYFERKPGCAYSIEGLFEAIRGAMPRGIKARVAKSRFARASLPKIMWNIAEAFTRRGDVNHVTGHVHYLAMGLPTSRTVLTVHDCACPPHLRGLKRWLFYFLWFWVPVRKATFITAISESTKRELISLTGCDPRKVRVIPDCVSPDFAPSALRFNGECPNVLHVGTKPNKNLVRVAQALSGIGCHLTVIGKPSLAQEEALRAAQVDYSWRANLSRREMVRSYQECDLVVFASTYEGFGLPILEAQASGRPVITSDLPPMKDVAGKESCLVDPFDVSSIREGILRVIRDDGYRDELVRCGLSNVRRFSAEQVAMDYARIYAEALGRDLDL